MDPSAYLEYIVANWQLIVFLIALGAFIVSIEAWYGLARNYTASNHRQDTRGNRAAFFSYPRYTNWEEHTRQATGTVAGDEF